MNGLVGWVACTGFWILIEDVIADDEDFVRERRLIICFSAGGLELLRSRDHDHCGNTETRFGCFHG